MEKSPFDRILNSFHELLQAQLDDQRRYFEEKESSMIKGFEDVEKVRFELKRDLNNELKRDLSRIRGNNTIN